MSNNDKKQGLLVVISGPAGSGKGTVIVGAVMVSASTFLGTDRTLITISTDIITLIIFFIYRSSFIIIYALKRIFMILFHLPWLYTQCFAPSSKVCHSLKLMETSYSHIVCLIIVLNSKCLTDCLRIRYRYRLKIAER